MFDPGAGDRADAETASMAVWFDAFAANVDRTPRNANLLNWHRELYFIDHGAALYFHHDWGSMPEKAESAFAQSRQHVLLPWASRLEEADEKARVLLRRDLLEEILEAVPDKWLSHLANGLTEHHDGISSEERRRVYLDFFVRRLASSARFVEEADRARAELV
jgi:hypothetical protein